MSYQSDYSGAQVDEAVGKALNPDATPTADSTNLVTSGGVASAVSAVQNTVSRRNLLDNGWFTINQRGQNSYTGDAYTVDRWRFQNNSGTCTVVSGGIQFSNSASGYGYFTQYLESAMDSAKTYTLSVIADGQVSSAQTGSTVITLPSGLLLYFANSQQITIRVPGNLNSSEVISAVKLELGSISTLANDSPPCIAEELAKCQRYYWEMKASAAYALLALGMGTASNIASFKIQHPVTMRDSASVTASGTFGCNSASFASATFRNNSGAKTTNYSVIEFDTTISQGTATTLQDFGSNNATLKFSAEL